MSPRLETVLAKHRLVPVVILEDAGRAVDLAGALLEAGLDVMEITFRTKGAAEALRRVVEGCPGMVAGAGTLLDGEQVRRAADAGAAFGLAPGLDEATVGVAQGVGLPFVPGVMTPSEVQRGLSLGCRLQKFFPAEAAGGAPFLKALEGPFAHCGVRFIPTGGVNAENAAGYLKLSSVMALGGSWFVDRRLTEAGDWAAITRLTREALAVTGKVS
ncbi:MAG: bifunctional 4-hydroxy-2-oxoglutarate aldolase/2-dehydro-3-deoxy-phosphogluconate aldolase [Verrucomicrobiia bacterium]